MLRASPTSSTKVSGHTSRISSSLWTSWPAFLRSATSVRTAFGGRGDETVLAVKELLALVDRAARRR
jgi:hypothetical protein